MDKYFRDAKKVWVSDQICEGRIAVITERKCPVEMKVLEMISRRIGVVANRFIDRRA